MKNFYTAVLFCAGLNVAQAQTFDTGSVVFMNDVSNNGVAVGIVAATHIMWTEASGTNSIGVLASGEVSGMTSISSDAKYISGTMTNPATGVDVMAHYDVAAQTWNYVGNVPSNQPSSAWGMTSDGSTVVGLGERGNYVGHAIKWSQASGLVDLGSTVPGRSSRANGINDDGSIVVGWQDDDYGDRFGVYWKNGVQTYLKDQNGDYVGEVSSVTPDGKTMIGNNWDKPYIWTEADGYTEVVNANPMLDGSSTAISDDGKTVIGYFREWGTGAFSGRGFIWTKETGPLDLNGYIQNLGLDDLGITFSLPLGISPNGKYIVGIGQTADDLRGFVIKLPGALGTDGVNSTPKFSVYPNPVRNVLHLSNTDKITGIELYNMAGQQILAAQKVSKIGLDVSKLEKGSYVLKIKTATETESIKVLKK